MKTLRLTAALGAICFVLGCTDTDGDGFIDWGARDCDDSDPNIYPGAPELCDNVDNDCDGDVDEAGLRVFVDDDRDGVGSNEPFYVCTFSLPAGAALRSGDCNDLDAAVHPGAVEYCDGIDNDCDGATDENSGEWYFYDGDDDGYGDGEAERYCGAPAGWVLQDGDCNDREGGINPGADGDACGAVEIDADCDGVIRCGDPVGPDELPLAERGEDIGGTSVTPVVPVALAEGDGIFVFRSAVSGPSVVTSVTYIEAPVDDFDVVDARTELGAGVVVREALAWTDLDDDGLTDIVAHVETDEGDFLVALSTEVLVGGGRVPEIGRLAFDDGTWFGVGPGADRPLVVARTVDGAPTLEVRDAEESQWNADEPAAAWTVADGVVAFGATSGDEGRLIALADDGGDDGLFGFASAAVSSLDEADAARALTGNAVAAAIVPGPLDADSGRRWILTARRIGDSLEAAWVLDSLRSVTREAGYELDAGASDAAPHAAWAAGTAETLLIYAAGGEAYATAWTAGPTGDFARVVAPDGGAIDGRLVRLGGVGPDGADGVFFGADDGTGWVVWAD